MYFGTLEPLLQSNICQPEIYALTNLQFVDITCFLRSKEKYDAGKIHIIFQYVICHKIDTANSEQIIWPLTYINWYLLLFAFNSAMVVGLDDLVISWEVGCWYWVGRTWTMLPFMWRLACLILFELYQIHIKKLRSISYFQKS